jgi:Mg2+ and Co2+ transporter CorA
MEAFLVLTINLIKGIDTGGWKCKAVEALPKSVGTDEVVWIDMKDPVAEEIRLLQDELAIDLGSLRDFSK